MLMLDSEIEFFPSPLVMVPCFSFASFLSVLSSLILALLILILSP
jgi:hypothetical protein